MSQLAAPAGVAARAAVLLELLAPPPSLPPNATSNESDWGAAQGVGAGSSPPNSSSPVTSGGGGGGSGTPGWQTGLLTVLVAAAVILAVVTMFLLITSRLRRQRRQVLAALARIQEAEMADLEAADLAAARRWHAGTVARAMERRSRQPPQAAAAHRAVNPAVQRGALPGGRPGCCPAPPPVVVIHPDLGVGLCTKEEPAGGGSEGCERREGAPGGGGLAPSSPAPDAAPWPAAGGAAGAAAAEAAEEPPLPRLPVQLQRIALEFPGLGAAVLLLLPHQHGWLVWREGSNGQPAAPWGPLPPISSVEVLPEEAAAPEGGAQRARQELTDVAGPGRAADSEGRAAGTGSTQ